MLRSLSEKYIYITQNESFSDDKIKFLNVIIERQSSSYET